MVIWFNSKTARNQLINNGVVITCRKQRKQFGTHQAYFTNDKRIKELIGYVDVEYLYESYDRHRNHDPSFKEYLSLSGFTSIEEWKGEVKGFVKSRWMPSYVIFLKVTMDREIY